MTQLIVDLKDINYQLPSATTIEPVRVRLIGQTLLYNLRKNHLVVRSLTDQEVITVLLSDSHQYSKDLVTKGATVDIDGYFNSKVIQAVEMNHANLDSGNLDLLQQFARETNNNV